MHLKTHHHLSTVSSVSSSSSSSFINSSLKSYLCLFSITNFYDHQSPNTSKNIIIIFQFNNARKSSNSFANSSNSSTGRCIPVFTKCSILGSN